MCDRLVETFPDSLAPNTLTLVGFIHAILPAFIMFFVGGASLEGPLPKWFFFLQFYAFLTYRVLDECDGKQARRTGNSSPLGLIFDHGCDCFAAGCQAMMLLRTAQVGNNMYTITMLTLGLWSFHFTTLEEYYIGILRLPPGNAVSDGLVPALLLFLCAGIFGYDVYTKELLDVSFLGFEGTKLTIG